MAAGHSVDLDAWRVMFTDALGRIAAGLADRHWHRYSAGAGAKGHRVYAWAWARIDIAQGGWRRLLIRRNTATGELAFYRCHAPGPVPLLTLVRIAGIRWAVEESFQAAKGQAGLDHYQVRTWTGWHRHVTLAMLARPSSPQSPSSRTHLMTEVPR
ncbi:hypothetical protein [Streptosporangium sp. NPDC087985]|uniref:hypothetical protein n=1 Tax=Streptosporangium sp. NPDC087985 TaxID=3366196 RepID=UPI0038051AB9